ncbi:hypothetical protein CL673_03985 [Candidatus Bathyarchaeota archaeon]|nr:hypothetical protein [Candidatus Bathyarchaeota archaeon]MDP6048718.1 DUF167 domain-containing protein [Candidatus Bathyarchaeota archaeon]MDP6457835.1 DUF167 domain-containing protein [Candidatus Bathyarchaeota archaeon]MDP7207396.1 DUF167 domain-containing protein [Candidatus Bathyarchaeota archaeon]MDP7443479.1 DUF167 domain-containing protein [Candidatus Bathyarchaeota archaeon]
MRITVEVKAGSKKDGVIQGEGDHYIVRVKAQRKKGKANIAVLKLLKKHFGRQARIVSGLTSTTKIVEVEDKSY